jgi:hypothetical protein
MKVEVTMITGEVTTFHGVDEIATRDGFDRIIIYTCNWKMRTIIPVDSFIFCTEEDY